MTAKPEESNRFENDLVSLTVHRKPHCVVEYVVEASKAICVEAHKKAAKGIGKEVVVPGFRKGKAPPEIVAKRYPHELDKRWQEAIASRCYGECAQLTNIPLINRDASINFNMHSHARSGAKLTLFFETMPAIPSIDPAKCILEPVKRPDTSQEKVEETVRQVRMFFGQWNKAEARPIKEGDFVLLDIEIVEEDPPQTLFTNTRFEVADRSMAQWMKKLIIGKTPPTSVEGISEPDETLSEEEKRDYPPRKVRVTIHQIEEVSLPKLDEAFAKGLGVDSVEALKQRIESLLSKKADEHVREEQREQVTSFLLSHHFELPRSAVEQETRFRLQQMLGDPQFKAKWEASGQKEREEKIDQVRKQAEKAVRIFYLCRKVAVDQTIELSAKDVPAETADPIETILYPSAQHHDPRAPDIKQAEAYSRILLEKTEDWIIAHARTTPKAKKKETPKKPPTTKTVEKPKRKTASKKTATAKSAKPKRKSPPSPRFSPRREES